MNVLFLSPDFVLPAERGLRVRTLSQLRVLAGIAQIERITLLSLCAAEVSRDSLVQLERELPKVRAEPPIRQPASVRRHPSALLRFLRFRTIRGEPYLVAKSHNPAMHALVRRSLLSETYDIVYVGYLGMMAYLPDVRELAPRARVLLEQHNLEWQIFNRLATSLRPPLRGLVRWEARSLRQFEKQAMSHVDGVIAISEADAKGFRELAGIEAIVVPPFVQPGSARTEIPGSVPRLGYIGHLAWQPNVYGLNWFCRDVWPILRGQAPQATLTIAGPGLHKSKDGSLAVPPEWSRQGITTVGFVEDLENIYAATLGMVAPVVGGSGVRMKLLETMRAGMPTVTTSDGAAGLAVENGREVLIADNAADFAECTVRILSDASLRERLRRNGYAFLAARHSEAVARESMKRALGELP